MFNKKYILCAFCVRDYSKIKVNNKWKNTFETNNKLEYRVKLSNDNVLYIEIGTKGTEIVCILHIIKSAFYCMPNPNVYLN